MNYKKITDTIVGGIRDLHEEIDNLQQENTQVKQELLESYKAIIEVLEIQEKTYGSGMDLHLAMITYAHESKQLKLKAEKYIKENEK